MEFFDFKLGIFSPYQDTRVFCTTQSLMSFSNNAALEPEERSW